MKRTAFADGEVGTAPSEKLSPQAKRPRYPEETPERESGAFAVLPGEMIAQILRTAGLFAAARTAAASARLGP